MKQVNKRWVLVLLALVVSSLVPRKAAAQDDFSWAPWQWEEFNFVFWLSTDFEQQVQKGSSVDDYTFYFRAVDKKRDVIYDLLPFEYDPYSEWATQSVTDWLLGMYPGAIQKGSYISSYQGDYQIEMCYFDSIRTNNGVYYSCLVGAILNQTNADESFYFKFEYAPDHQAYVGELAQWQGYPYWSGYEINKVKMRKSFAAKVDHNFGSALDDASGSFQPWVAQSYKVKFQMPADVNGVKTSSGNFEAKDDDGYVRCKVYPSQESVSNYEDMRKILEEWANEQSLVHEEIQHVDNLNGFWGMYADGYSNLTGYNCYVMLLVDPNNPGTAFYVWLDYFGAEAQDKVLQIMTSFEPLPSN